MSFNWQCEECGTVRVYRYSGGCYRLLRCRKCRHKTEHVEIA